MSEIALTPSAAREHEPGARLPLLFALVSIGFSAGTLYLLLTDGAGGCAVLGLLAILTSLAGLVLTTSVPDGQKRAGRWPLVALAGVVGKPLGAIAIGYTIIYGAFDLTPPPAYLQSMPVRGPGLWLSVGGLDWGVLSHSQADDADGKTATVTIELQAIHRGGTGEWLTVDPADVELFDATGKACDALESAELAQDIWPGGVKNLRVMFRVPTNHGGLTIKITQGDSSSSTSLDLGGGRR